jgi:hypothetical protein
MGSDYQHDPSLRLALAQLHPLHVRLPKPHQLTQRCRPTLLQWPNLRLRRGQMISLILRRQLRLKFCL